MWRWGTPQNFCLGFIDNFEKTNIYLKNCWSRLIKNVRTLIFTRLYFFFFQKIRKNTQKDKDIIIFTQVSKNHDHMLYCSWDMASDGYNCYSWFWAILCPFTPLVSFFFFKNEKAPGETIILHKCTKNHDHMLYCSGDMAQDRCNYFSSWAIFCPITLPPNSPKNQDF